MIYPHRLGGLYAKTTLYQYVATMATCFLQAEHYRALYEEMQVTAVAAQAEVGRNVAHVDMETVIKV